MVWYLNTFSSVLPISLTRKCRKPCTCFAEFIAVPLLFLKPFGLKYFEGSYATFL